MRSKSTRRQRQNRLQSASMPAMSRSRGGKATTTLVMTTDFGDATGETERDQRIIGEDDDDDDELSDGEDTIDSDASSVVMEEDNNGLMVTTVRKKNKAYSSCFHKIW